MKHKEPRAIINVNRQWKFIRGDWEGFSTDGPEQMDYDDSNGTIWSAPFFQYSLLYGK